jgi:hypothetical protein
MLYVDNTRLIVYNVLSATNHFLDFREILCRNPLWKTNNCEFRENRHSYSHILFTNVNVRLTVICVFPDRYDKVRYRRAS